MAAKKKGRAKKLQADRVDVSSHLLLMERLCLLEDFQRTCEAHAVLPEWVLAGDRNPTTVEARTAFVMALKERGMSNAEVARIMNLDPTSIVTAVRRWKLRHGPKADPNAA